MDADEAFPIVIRKDRKAAALGCLAYALLASPAVFVGWVAAFFAAEEMRFQGSPLELFIAGGTPAYLIALGFAYRHYRLRATEVIQLWEDRLEFVHGRRSTSYPYDEMNLHDFFYAPMLADVRLVVRCPKRRSLVLKNEEWRLNWLVAALVDLAVPRIAARIRESIKEGQEARFLEPRGRLIGRIIFLLLVVGWGSIAILALIVGAPKRTGDWSDAVLVAILGLGAVPLLAMTVWSLRLKGAIITRSGIRSSGSPPGQELSWTAVKSARLDGDGLMLEGNDGRRVLTSRGCTNFPVLVELIRENLGDRLVEELPLREPPQKEDEEEDA